MSAAAAAFDAAVHYPRPSCVIGTTSADLPAQVEDAIIFQVHTGTCVNPFIPLRLHSQWNLSISSPLPDGSSLLTVVDTCTWLTFLRRLPNTHAKTLVGVLDSLVSGASASPSNVRHAKLPGTALASPQFAAWLWRLCVTEELSSFMRTSPNALHDGHVLEVCAAIDAAGGLPAEWWSQPSLDKIEHMMNTIKLGSLGISASANDAVRFFSSESDAFKVLQRKWNDSRLKARFERKPQGTASPAAASGRRHWPPRAWWVGAVQLLVALSLLPRQLRFQPVPPLERPWVELELALEPALRRLSPMTVERAQAKARARSKQRTRAAHQLVQQLIAQQLL